MGEGSDASQNNTGDETPGETGDPSANICGNCKTENAPEARICRVCFAPLAALDKICPNCMTGNPESAHLCRRCFTPLSSHATIDPIYGISARADTFSKASSAPRKPIVLLGMWVIFAPVGFVCLMTCIGILRGETAGGCVLLIPAVVVLFISVMLLIKTTANYLKAPPEDREGFPLGEHKDDSRAGETSNEDDDSAGPAG